MTALAPGVLVGITLGLFGLGLVGAVVPQHAGRWMAGSAGLCGLGALVAFVALLAGVPEAGFSVPLGPPGMSVALGLDALSAVFLLLLFVTGGACSVYALTPQDVDDRRALPFFPPFIAAMALTLLAADGFTLVFGFELMSLASWALVLGGHEAAPSRDAAQFYLGMALFGAACLIPAVTLLAPAGLDLRFAAIRAMPPDGWRAVAVLALVLLGAGSKAGLAPMHLWLPIAHPAAPSHASALMSGAMTKVALYVLVRVLFDLCGPAQPGWWGLPLLVMGAASAVLGGLRANTEADLKTVLAASTIENVGFIAIGFGLALMARAVDLPALASLALGAALLHTLNHGVFKTLLFLCAGAVRHGAGSRVLARLGGLIHRMPIVVGCTLVGCAGLAGLPPGPGFASEWLLFQSVLAGPRLGGHRGADRRRGGRGADGAGRGAGSGGSGAAGWRRPARAAAHAAGRRGGGRPEADMLGLARPRRAGGTARPAARPGVAPYRTRTVANDRGGHGGPRGLGCGCSHLRDAGLCGAGGGGTARARLGRNRVGFAAVGRVELSPRAGLGLRLRGSARLAPVR